MFHFACTAKERIRQRNTSVLAKDPPEECRGRRI
jgi:hypothetical protein